MCDKIFSRRATAFRVENRGIRGGYFVENGKTGRFLTLRTDFFGFQRRQSCRCGENPPAPRWKTDLTYPHPPVENFVGSAFSTGVWKVCPHFPRQILVEKGGFFAKTGRFWRISQTFKRQPVQNLFFPHGFPQLVEKSWENPQGGCGSRGKVLGQNTIFHKGTGATFYDPSQLPLISLIISSISVRKTGFCTMRFSTVSREDMTVEWSRSMILPILGRDISVI